MMKNLISLLTVALLVIACGPSRHAIHVEMRHPSRSGIDLAGKIVSVVYVSDADSRLNAVRENMSEAFAKSLEEGYGTGEGSIGLFCVDKEDGEYTSRDSLVSLLMHTGSDVVFLMNVGYSGDQTQAGQPVRVGLFCYDGMNKDELVKQFTGVRVLAASSEEELLAEASKAGRKMSEPFESQWKHEQYSIAYYDNARWYEALVRADRYDWKGAMDIWMELLDTHDMMKRAAAEYNLAVACYMLGDFDLATLWLDQSDSDNKLPTLSDALRKRIEARKR